MAAPKCVACGVERKLVFAEVVTARYEIRSFRCPVCKTTVQSVQEDRSRSPQRWIVSIVPTVEKPPLVGWRYRKLARDR